MESVNTATQEQSVEQPSPATAPVEQPPVETIVATQPTQAELDAEFEAYYEARNSGQSAPAAEGSATVEPAQAEIDTQATSTEQSPAASPQAQAGGDEDAEIPGQLRPRLHDQKDIALHIFAKANGITVMEAARRMLAGEPRQEQGIPGVEPGTTAAAQVIAPPPSAAIQVQVDALTAEIKTEREGEGYLTPEYHEKAERLSDLKADLRFARAEEVRLTREAQARDQEQSQNTTAEFNAQWSAHAATVAAAHPDLANPKSALCQMASLARLEMEAAKDPRLNQVTAPLAVIEVALAKMKDMGITPAAPATVALSKAPAQAAPVPPSPAVPPPRRVAPASGSRSQQTGGSHPTIGAAVAATNDPKELERLFDEAAESGELTTAFRRR